MHTFVFSTGSQLLLFYDNNPLVTSLIFYLVLFLIIAFLLRIMGRKPAIKDHWYYLFEQGDFSSQEFYQTTMKSLEEMKIPKIRFAHSEYSEGGVLSANRDYMIVYRGSLRYIICAAPFGTAFFVSWRQSDTTDLGQKFLAAIPLFGRAFERVLFSQTYYERDTEIMFQDTIHNTVLKIVDTMALAKGVRKLTELERKPILAKR